MRSPSCKKNLMRLLLLSVWPGIWSREPGGNHKKAPVPPSVTLLIIFVLFFCIPAVGADLVNLTTPQSDYYVPVGIEAVIPVTIVSTYDHDITGTLVQSMVLENPANTGPLNTTTRTRAFSAFTDVRTVSLSVGESDVPADYLLTLSFNYNENGARSATLPEMGVHFVTGPPKKPGSGTPLSSTDTMQSPNVASSSSGLSLTRIPQQTGPVAALVNSQIPQDTLAFRTEMQREMNRSSQEQDILLGYITADPLVESFNQSLSEAGYTLEQTSVQPHSNSSGTFSLSYVDEKKNAIISGSVNDSRILFAREFSYDPVPLPGPLAENVSYQDYQNLATTAGFTLNRTIINATPDRQEIDVAFANPGNRILHATATIRNETVTMFAGESPDDPLADAGTIIALVAVVLLCGGIWYFARLQQPYRPGPDDPAPPESLRDAAVRLLAEAEAEAAGNRYPEAYRMTSRALRLHLSGTQGNGKELTSRELRRSLSTAEETGTIRWILERGEAVGFAKDIPDAGEIRKMILCTRHILEKGDQHIDAPELDPGNPP